MSTMVAGDSTNYPASITIPSDGDGPIQAADVNVAFEALADRTAYVASFATRLAALQPLNIVSTYRFAVSMQGDTNLTFAEVGASGDTITRSSGSWLDDGFRVGDVITVAGSASNNISTGVIVTLTALVLTLDSTDLAAEGPVGGVRVTVSGLEFMRGALFDYRIGRWYVFGNDLDLRASHDLGVTWSSRRDYVTSHTASTNNDIAGGAVDPLTSNAVFPIESGGSATGDVLRVAAGASTTSTVSAGLIDNASPLIVWEPITGRFVAVTTGGLPKCRYSSTGATWSNGGSMPGGWLNLTIATMGVNPTSGRVVAIGHSSGQTLEVVTSDNGGTTWSARTDITCTMSSDPTRLSIAYEAETEIWVLTVGHQDTTYETEIYTSDDDGATWTLATTLTSVCLIGLAVDGPTTWLAIALHASTSPRLVHSIDSGATWRTTGLTVSSSTATDDVGGCALGGGRFAIVDGDAVRMTMAAGTPTMATVT
jgi:hypothetical protein